MKYKFKLIIFILFAIYFTFKLINHKSTKILDIGSHSLPFKLNNSEKTKFKNKTKQFETKNLKITTKKNSIDSILCVVLTSKESFFERGEAVWDSWARKCNHSVFATNLNHLKLDITISRENMIKKFNFLNLNHVDESHYKMAEKMIHALKLIYETNSNDFNWFLITDDDTFIFVDSLFKFAKSKNSNEAFTYGYNFKHIIKNGFHAGGAGILIPIESLKRLYNSIINGKCELINGYGDAAMGRCSELSSVRLGNSL